MRITQIQLHISAECVCVDIVESENAMLCALVCLSWSRVSLLIN